MKGALDDELTLLLEEEKGFQEDNKFTDAKILVALVACILGVVSHVQISGADGTLADWGGGKYHVEFTVSHDKQEATVYVLGSDEKSPAPIKTDKISLMIGDPELQADLLPVPLEGETDGLSSRFVGKHEKLGIVQEYAGSMSAEIEGTPYTGDFKEEAHDAHDHK